MRWHDHFEVEFFQGRDGRWNDRLKQRAGEVKSADHRIRLLHAGQFLSLSDRINGPCVTTTGEHYQAFVFEVYNHSLIVMDVWVFLPLIVAQGIMYGKPGLKIGRTVNLSSHQHEATKHVGRATLLDELDTVLRKNAPVRWWQVDLVTVRKNH